jgi:hypothetical protein
LKFRTLKVPISPHTSVVAGLVDVCNVALVVVVTVVVVVVALLVVRAAVSLAVVHDAGSLTIPVVVALMQLLFSSASMRVDATYITAIIWCLWWCTSLGPSRICEILE